MIPRRSKIYMVFVICSMLFAVYVWQGVEYYNYKSGNRLQWRKIEGGGKWRSGPDEKWMFVYRPHYLDYNKNTWTNYPDSYVKAIEEETLDNQFHNTLYNYMLLSFLLLPIFMVNFFLLFPAVFSDVVPKGFKCFIASSLLLIVIIFFRLGYLGVFSAVIA